MKASLIQWFAFLACTIMVLCTQVDAKKKVDLQVQPPCIADPGMEMFCEKSRAQLNRMIEDVFANVPRKGLKTLQNGITTTSTERNRMNAIAQAQQLGLYTDIKEYFMNYWNNLKLIFQGKFGEGIFNQLKNSGSWCEKDSWVVKAIKAGINLISGGAVTTICDCLYPMIKSYDNYHQIVADVESRGLAAILGKCTSNLKDQIMKALKKTGNP
ncbi:hypothetical protein BGZ65_002727 [Modicella reniformis]|uniref:Secreted protein n=1 Tax=Modicella reniformis TaxID=1440133 RepID=A0A9P6LSS0_9FUNG|nr:hypothetical protein BGZ65_002727 [Modicella reniformis]